MLINWFAEQEKKINLNFYQLQKFYLNVCHLALINRQAVNQLKLIFDKEKRDDFWIERHFTCVTIPSDSQSLKGAFWMSGKNLLNGE